MGPRQGRSRIYEEISMRDSATDKKKQYEICVFRSHHYRLKDTTLPYQLGHVQVSPGYADSDMLRAALYLPSLPMRILVSRFPWALARREAAAISVRPRGIPNTGVISILTCLLELFEYRYHDEPVPISNGVETKLHKWRGC